MAVQCIHVQGGPPFITDDPGTPGNRHWEINLGWIADHNPGLACYQLPDFDIKYGWGDSIQLKYELPIAAYTNQNNTAPAGPDQRRFRCARPSKQHRDPGSYPARDTLRPSRPRPKATE
jgi:hypothetical protein